MQRTRDISVTSCCLFSNKVGRQSVLPCGLTAAKSIVMVILLLVSGLLSSCGLLQKFGILSSPEAPAATAMQAPPPLSEQPYQLNLKLSASSDLNPDSQSRPSPVQVRIFITEAQSELGSKEFAEIFDFAGNYIDPRPLTTKTVRPGESMDIVLPANKAQSLVVIAAAYRDPYQSLWKAIASVTPMDAVDISATLGANAVTIKPSP